MPSFMARGRERSACVEAPQDSRRGLGALGGVLLKVWPEMPARPFHDPGFGGSSTPPQAPQGLAGNAGQTFHDPGFGGSSTPPQAPQLSGHPLRSEGDVVVATGAYGRATARGRACIGEFVEGRLGTRVLRDPSPSALRRPALAHNALPTTTAATRQDDVVRDDLRRVALLAVLFVARCLEATLDAQEIALLQDLAERFGSSAPHGDPMPLGPFLPHLFAVEVVLVGR